MFIWPAKKGARCCTRTISAARISIRSWCAPNAATRLCRGRSTSIPAPAPKTRDICRWEPISRAPAASHKSRRQAEAALRGARSVGRQGGAVGWVRRDPVHIGEARRGDRHPVAYRPGQAGGEQYVGGAKPAANQETPAILQRLLRMAQLSCEILGGAFQCHLRLAIDVLQSAMAAHDVEARCVELGRGIEAPFEPGRILARLGRDQ